MSTIEPIDVGHHYHEEAAASALECQPVPDAGSTPRSILNESMYVGDDNSLSGRLSKENLTIDLPLCSRATLSMEIVRDGMFTKVCPKSSLTRCIQSR